MGNLNLPISIALLVFSLSNTASAQSSECLGYQPVMVTLAGVITKHTFFGPPNYGEDPAHDSKEGYWFLDLDSPICVNGIKGDFLNSKTERDVRHLEIIYEHGYPKGPGWVRHHVSITGTLLHSFTGHHHTPVLITAEKTVKTK